MTLLLKVSFQVRKDFPFGVECLRNGRGDQTVSPEKHYRLQQLFASRFAADMSSSVRTRFNGAEETNVVWNRSFHLLFHPLEMKPSHFLTLLNG